MLLFAFWQQTEVCSAFYLFEIKDFGLEIWQKMVRIACCAMKFSCVVLCGGQSRRMGTNKAFLKIGGKYIIEGLIEKLKDISENILVVVDKREKYAQITKYGGVRILEDEQKNFGPVEGIRVGLTHSSEALSFICACDMPLVDPKCVEELHRWVQEGIDCVIPVVNGKNHPLHGFYSRRILPVVEELVSAGKHRIVEIFKRVNTRFVESFGCDMERSIVNLNYPSEVKHIIWKEGGVWKEN